MKKYDICQFSILQDIPVREVDLTESPVKKFKPSLTVSCKDGRRLIDLIMTLLIKLIFNC